MRSNQFRSNQSKSFTERRKRRTIIGASAGVLAAVSWIYILSALSFSQAVSISKVEVFGTDPDIASNMTATAYHAMTGAYMGIFSRANAFIYPHDEIAREIASSSPRVSKVEIKRDGLHGLAVSVSERTPVAVICPDLPDLSETGLQPIEGCMAADERGFMFKELKTTEQTDLPTFYLPELPDSGLAGTFATSTEKFRSLQALFAGIKSAGINIHAILVKESRDYEIYADNPDGKSIAVIDMNDRSSLDIQKENLIAFWARMVAEGRAKGALPTWNEIKLQFPPNVYSR